MHVSLSVTYHYITTLTTLHYITLHYITVFSAGPTTTRTGPAIQVSMIMLTTKTMNVKSGYVNVKKVSAHLCKIYHHHHYMRCLFQRHIFQCLYLDYVKSPQILKEELLRIPGARILSVCKTEKNEKENKKVATST